MNARLPMVVIIVAIICGCASKEVVTTSKTYEDYFPQIRSDQSKETAEYGQEETDSEENFLSEFEDGEASVTFSEKSVCKAKPAPGPRKIGKPYYVDGIKYYPLDTADGYTEEGVASWYGPGFHGKLTANGETYNQKDMTAAHKTLPMPTYVRVENLENGKEIIVRVNDRGPFSKGRIIDLSEEGARRIGMIEKGTARVRVSVLSESADCYVSSGKEIDLDSGSFAVQIAAFSSEENAFRLSDKFGRKAVVNKGYVKGVLWHRVWIVGFTSKIKAEKAAKNFETEYSGAFVIAR